MISRITLGPNLEWKRRRWKKDEGMVTGSFHYEVPCYTSMVAERKRTVTVVAQTNNGVFDHDHEGDGQPRHQ